VPEYVLGHHLKGEGKRLALMSELLDPRHRRYLQSLGVVKSGARTLEAGCGNGSISAWLARQVAPDDEPWQSTSIFRWSSAFAEFGFRKAVSWPGQGPGSF
jgi:hypothetical protein